MSNKMFKEHGRHSKIFFAVTLTMAYQIPKIANNEINIQQDSLNGFAFR